MSSADDLAPTGVLGLDDILRGGLPRKRTYLVQGDPGVGKTTLGLQFLLDGVARKERCLYITLSETEEEVRAIARSHGWTLDGIHLLELSAVEQTLEMDADNTLFVASEVELRETTSTLLKRVEEVNPQRVVFDSLSELRLLAQNPLRYRREILALKQYFAGKNATVLLLDDRTAQPADLQLQSLAHGVLAMEQWAPPYGGDRRRLRVTKLRGVQARSGYHDFVIERGGLLVFPRLVAAEHHRSFAVEPVSSGVKELDQLLGGGIDRGTSTLIIGPAGSGKSTLAAQYAVSAARGGGKAAIFAFDESLHTLIARSDALGLGIADAIDKRQLLFTQIDPAEMGPGEFAHRAREVVERQGARMVVIDSLNGLLNSMPEEAYLQAQMHELLTYFGQLGVTTVLVLAQHGMFGGMQAPVDLTYLADGVVLLRFFEAEGHIRKAISVVKKRSGAHENAIRELVFERGGIRLGPALEGFLGVLTGTPTYQGTPEELIRKS